MNGIGGNGGGCRESERGKEWMGGKERQDSVSNEERKKM